MAMEFPADAGPRASAPATTAIDPRAGRAVLVMLVVILSAGLTSYFLWKQRETEKSRQVVVDGDSPAQAVGTSSGKPSTVQASPMAEEGSKETVAEQPEGENPDASGLLAKSEPGAPAATSTEQLLADWKTPQLCFAITGQAHGYLEPCGCSERQVGGYSRRADFLRYLREDKKWPVIAVDIGGLLKNDRYFHPQMRWKLEALVKGLARMHYDALAIGMEDLKFGPQRLFELYQEFKNVDPNFHLPFLGANLTIIDKSLGMPLDYTIVERGGKKVAIVSIYGDAWKNEISSFSTDELKVAGVEETLTRVLGELKEKKPDLLVLLSHDSLDNSKKWAAKFPAFQIVVSAGGYEDPPKVAEKVGKTMVVTSGMKGRTVGVIGYYPADAAQPFKYTNIEVAPETLKNTESMTQVMREYQDQLKDHWESLITEPIPSERKFVGVETCRDCHANSCKIWDGTKHAKGYVSLQVGRKGQGKEFVPRTFDPECLCCHTVGWNPQTAHIIESGFRDMEKTPHLAGQQCENCHGPASEHVALETDGSKMPEMLAARKAMHRDKTTAEAACRKCHDGENDIHWEEVGFEKRWADIVHPGKD